MKEKNRYWRNGVFAVLALGVSVTIVSALWSLSLVDLGDGTPFWEHALRFGMIVTSIGVIGWLCLTVPTDRFERGSCVEGEQNNRARDIGGFQHLHG